MIAVHVTHEAVEKMGGIGAVIEGLVTTHAYGRAFSRTLLVGPLLETDRPAAERLGPGGQVIYSSLDDIDTGNWASKFKPIQQSYQVGIVYGRRTLTDGPTARDAEVEVLLLDVFHCNRDRLNLFKAGLFTKFSVPSDRFEGIWEFEQYVRLAEPACEALHVIGCHGSREEPLIVLAHEYMGLPLALKAIMAGEPGVETVFYAHEVASVRRVVESHPGHDLMFYNLLRSAESSGKGIEEYFPDLRDHFKHPLIKAAWHCDAIFAVGDYVGREMRFMEPAHPAEITLMYNGVAGAAQTLPQRQAHRALMRQYARNLFGFEPTHVFTHVARPVMSKAIWRDLRVLHELDATLGAAGRTAVYFMLGTLAGQRRTRDVLHMERVYGWPVHHTCGYPDLCNGEETVGSMFENFNGHHEHVRVVLVNQFGWSRRLCGMRMPEAASIADIRCGTDAEFGMSLYEPFGISQLEPLGYGAVCVVSNVCGCLGFLHHVHPGPLPDNVLEADFTRLPAAMEPEAILGIGLAQREAVEDAECRRLAGELLKRLPGTDQDVERMLKAGWDLGRRVSWDRVVEDYFLPALHRICKLDELNGK